MTGITRAGDFPPTALPPSLVIYMVENYDELSRRYDLGVKLAHEQGLMTKADSFSFAMAFAMECASMDPIEATDMCAALEMSL